MASVHMYKTNPRHPRPGQIALKVKILLVFLCRVFGLLKVKARESFHRFLPKKTV